MAEVPVAGAAPAAAATNTASETTALATKSILENFQILF